MRNADGTVSGRAAMDLGREDRDDRSSNSQDPARHIAAMDLGREDRDDNEVNGAWPNKGTPQWISVARTETTLHE